ncbi:nuclear transport factor 2 family protein [Jatrophihabitans lederbergiae]|uniref:Nuclear transport factor 2 family protein n=1 Tax=Jatrophihabitans lederbergiae TaxID=3075547 RepID=A0ABU2JAV3_9ACTN|nr:nuclear transport factor 2 family protein [Jatrophihabitans sp. DSM 44399]MDT0262126.1 nuclear transport factor 2 family protein [Jatrophihabitans sp. DSM 44399]
MTSTKEITVTDLNAVVDDYIAVWNETDAGARTAKIEKLWAEDAVYTDPLASVVGRDGFNQVLQGAQDQFKGLQFVRGTTFDAHHNIVRFTWELVTAPGTEAIVVGFDVAVIGEDGKISGVSGFIDKMPAAA